MTTAIIGTGNIGGQVARHLVAGGEPVVLAARDESHAAALANELGPLASAASVRQAIGEANVVVLALWLDTTKRLIAENGDLLHRKVVVDTSNPIQLDGKGGFSRTLPDGQSAASVIAGLLPADAQLVKAFGTLGAEALASSANRTPQRAALFYATDDEGAASTVERLITTAGFDPVKAGGLSDAGRIEVSGDLHQFGGLNGNVVDAEEARAAVAVAA
ncbi:MAG TPA: NAD(P)-binding domain-containing protein [Jatrophihabitantaceae bacterium]|jgi:predicted dinucleotide-binding enzyme|nr:NAD(P)-binding domain-containing protein [Jatrophihabitantaceae bacterium]